MSDLELATDRMKSYGLTLEHMKALNIEVLSAAETKAVDPAFYNLPTLRIRYMDPWNPGKPLTASKGWSGFQRLRYLVDPPPTTKGRVPKYAQSAKSGVCAYFPTLRDWAPVRKDTNLSLIITEGEMKAAKACERGFYTIGLGGVSNFINTGIGKGVLDELLAIDWVQREVYLVFDNDGDPKPDVIAALNRLAAELCELGAIVYNVFLPSVKSGKTGLDDYFIANPSTQEFEELLLTTRISLTFAQPLWDLNSRYLLVRSPTMIVDRDKGTMLDIADFNVIYGKLTHREMKLTDQGTPSQKRMPLAPAWLKWAMRAEVDRVCYSPGRPEIENDTYNTWPGWGTTPVKGDVKPFLALVDRLFDSTSISSKEEARLAKEWFLRWCAYPIQHPGAKMYSTAVLWGGQGTGKTLLVMALKRIYGENFHELDATELDSTFNGWSAKIQLVLGDDVVGSDKRSYAAKLKKMITQDTINLNEKFMPAYSIRDCINYIFTSNENDSFFMDRDDRRNFIWEVTAEKLPDGVGRELREWMQTEEGGNALHYFFLNLPMGNFEHTAPAFETTSKHTMIDIAKSSLDVWCSDLRVIADRIFMNNSAELFCAKELLRLYDPEGKHKVSPSGMGKAMGRAGYKQVLGGQPILWSGGQDRFFAVRNADRWLKTTAAEVKKHLSKTKPQPSPLAAQYRGVS